jgi:hypothetical protein
MKPISNRQKTKIEEHAKRIQELDQELWGEWEAIRTIIGYATNMVAKNGTDAVGAMLASEDIEFDMDELPAQAVELAKRQRLRWAREAKSPT